MTAQARHPATSASVRAGSMLAAAFVLVLLAACRGETPAYTTRLTAFGTSVDMTLAGVNPREAEYATGLLLQDFAFVTKAWSPYGPGPLRRVNDLLGSGKPFAAPPSVLPLIRESQRYATQSGDLFNPAIGLLTGLWGFGQDPPQSHAPPSRGEIERLVTAQPRMSDIHVDGIELHCDNPAVKLNFGTFAVGRAIDLAVAHLRDLGIRNAMVGAGGGLRVIGDRGGRPWRIPIRRATGGGVFAMIAVGGDESVFTSAEYDRTFVYNGKTYHDIIDPRTGYPADGARAVTVIASSAASAAAAANALFVAGRAQWREVAERMGTTHVLLVDRNGNVHMTPEMERRIELVDKGVAIEIGEPLKPDTRGQRVTPP